MARGLSGFRFHPLYYPDDGAVLDRQPRARCALGRRGGDGLILQYHMYIEHAPALDRMIARHSDVRVIVHHLGKPDVAEAPRHPSFQAVLGLARHPLVWIKIGDYQIASREPYPCRDTFPFVAALRQAFGPARMLLGHRLPQRRPTGAVEQALRYVREDLPSLSAADRQILGSTPAALFGF